MVSSAPVEIHVAEMLMSIGRLVEKDAARYLTRKYKLTYPQYQLLLAAMASDEVNLGDLSEQLQCSRGNLTGVADRLERDGWIKRERDVDDRRVIHLLPTSKGCEVLAIRDDIARHQKEKVAKILSQADLAILHVRLTQLHTGLTAAQQPSDAA